MSTITIFKSYLTQLDQSREFIHRTSKVRIENTLWFSLVGLLIILMLYFWEEGLEGKMKSLRKKITECEVVSGIKGKGDEKWKVLTEMLRAHQNERHQTSAFEELFH